MRLFKGREGFTLIELVVVIIVLGILAVIALPKFIDFRADADIAVLKGMQGSIKSARDLVAAQIALRPENLNNLNTDRCYLYYFTPNDSNVTEMGVLPSVELDLTDCG